MRKAPSGTHTISLKRLDGVIPGSPFTTRAMPSECCGDDNATAITVAGPELAFYHPAHCSPRKVRRYQHAVTGDKSERKEGPVLTSALYPGRGCGGRVGGRHPARAARSGVGGHRDGTAAPRDATAVPATGQTPAAAELPVHNGR